MNDKKDNCFKDSCIDGLKSINGIHFTAREIDIIACLLNARGTSRIASLLEISPRTVGNHIRNLMVKLGCNSREGIIDFIEKDNKKSLLRAHYSHLSLERAFQDTLKAMGKLIPKSPFYSLIYEKEQKDYRDLVEKLKMHFERAGLTIHLEIREKQTSLADLINESKDGEYAIYMISNPLDGIKNIDFSQNISSKNDQMPSNALFLFLKKLDSGEIPHALGGIKCIDFSKSGNYYVSVFEIFKTLFPQVNFENKIEDFKNRYELTHESVETKNSQESVRTPKELPFSTTIKSNLCKLRRWSSLIILFAAISALSIGFFTLQEIRNALPTTPSIRSDLLLPSETALLNRPKLIDQIDNKFKSQKDGIQTVAIIGIGGAGKTTLARLYAQQQKAKIIWEINAETKESIIRSITNFAYALAQTEEELQQLKRLEKIKNSAVKENQFVEFVKNKMKKLPGWFLIYDNVDNIVVIEPYFPRDAESWGKGRILITTRDNHIENNNHVNATIQISEVSSEEKLTLFTKVMNKGGKVYITSLQKEQTQKLLEAIPSFPLDISLAAYYLRSTGTNYEEYLENLKNYREEFINNQSHIVNNISNYNKTRYGIVYVSLNHILKTNEKFKNLLLLISLIDSQHIPRSLLDYYTQDSVLVDNFIFHLKKYSLITDGTPSLFYKTPTLFMHSSTQQIILSHLNQKLDLKKNEFLLSPIIQALGSIIDEAMDQENIQKMRILINHCKKLLSHTHLLKNQIIESLNSHLGQIYYHFGDYLKAKTLFENNLTLLNQDKEDLKVAHTLLYLGTINRKLGQYQKAKALLESSLKIFNQHLPKNYGKIAEAKVSLGGVYRMLGDYEKAKTLLHESCLIYQQNPRENLKWMAWAHAHLGNIYRNLGDYDKAQTLMEKSLKIYHNHFPKEQVRQARVLSFLAVVYRERGDYKKAKNLLEKSLRIYHHNALDHHADAAWSLCILATIYKAVGDSSKAINLLKQGVHIYKTFYPENQVDISWALSHLGVAYKNIGYHEKAKSLIEESVAFYQAFFGEHNIRTSWALINAATVYKELGYYDKAKDILEKSFLPYEKHYGKEHIILARILRDLGDLHLLLGNTELSEDLLKKALLIFNKNVHPEKYTCLESLSSLYMKKAFLQEKNKNFTVHAEKHKMQATTYLKQALNVLKAHFPESSLHRKRIENKFNNLAHE